MGKRACEHPAWVMRMFWDNVRGRHVEHHLCFECRVQLPIGPANPVNDCDMDMQTAVGFIAAQFAADGGMTKLHRRGYDAFMAKQDSRTLWEQTWQLTPTFEVGWLVAAIESHDDASRPAPTGRTHHPSCCGDCDDYGYQFSCTM